MFKELEKELMSIISTDPIDKISHMPSKEIAKTMELLYHIPFENILRVYTEKLDNIISLSVIYESESDIIIQDICPINGKLYYVILIPNKLLDMDTNNAITLSRTIMNYIAIRVSILSVQNKSILDTIPSTLDRVLMQAIPVISCSIMRQIYSGSSLSEVIYRSMCEIFDKYKTMYSKEGVETILNLLDEDLSVEELLDNGFICAIPVDDPKYPGIWKNNTNTENKND